ncbi:hypothetical protein VTO73DRAFT_15329 [Trametes versicolor]
MDTLPIETLQHIFELACTDGGSTGNSLSLASKHIRAAARRARFHTLRVAADSDTFPEFVAFFERECNYVREERPRVRHLYLTLASIPYVISETDRAQLMLAVQAQLDRLRRGLPLEDRPPVSPSCSERAAQELVRLVAPDLWSLVVQTVPSGPRDVLQYFIFEHTFPLLREAAFIGLLLPKRGRALSALHPNSDVKLSLRPIFPRITHLHLDPYLSTGELGLASWAVLAPCVTHLRVSNIRNLTHTRELAEVVGVSWVHSTVPFGVEARSPESPSSSITPSRTCSSVQHLLIEPEAKSEDRTRSRFCAHKPVWKSLSDIVDACRRADTNIQLTLLERPNPVPDVQYAEALVEQWVERIEGGEGWWKGLGLN